VNSSSPNDVPSDESLVDFEQLKTASADDRELVLQLIDLYFGQADEVMLSLEAAIKANSAADVNHLAHKLVGASLACGMNAMVPPLRRLESGGKQGQLADAPEIYVQVARYLQLTRARVNVLVQEYQS